MHSLFLINKNLKSLEIIIEHFVIEHFVYWAYKDIYLFKKQTLKNILAPAFTVFLHHIEAPAAWKQNKGLKIQITMNYYTLLTY